MRRLRLALSLLTVFPLRADLPPQEWPGAAPFFPLVGGLLGGALALANRLLSAVWPDPVTAALLVLLSWLLSGGIHLDGLADTADGLACRGSPEEALEVMRDPRVGAVGAAAAFLVLVLKFSCLEALAPLPRSAAALLMPVAGRQAMVLVMPRYRYPRAVPGLATPWAGKVTHRQAGGALGVTLLPLAVTGGLFPSLVLPSLVALAGALAGGVGFAAWVARRLGGMTGDTYGAICEIAETLFLLMVAASNP